MSWRDRTYADDEPQPQMRMQLNKPTTAVGWLIAINVAVLFVDAVVQRFIPVHQYFGLSLSGVRDLMVWQPLTYMFFHGDVLHLLFNMIGLYIFGTEFERAFGTRRFIRFYATCGLIGGLAYLVLPVLRPMTAGVPLVGASGAIYGLLMAAVIFFPHIQVIVIIFPMPIRVFALIVAGILLFQLIRPGQVQNVGGEICHVAGAVTAVVLFWAWGMLPGTRRAVEGDAEVLPFVGKWRRKWQEGAWERRQRKIAADDTEVDRILAKVHDQGIQSLSRSERKTLERATRRQQGTDRRAGRIDRL